MNNTVKLVAVCVAAPVMALGVAAPTAWAETGTGHSHTNGGPNQVPQHVAVVIADFGHQEFNRGDVVMDSPPKTRPEPPR
jgi:hypothetical protein